MTRWDSIARRITWRAICALESTDMPGSFLAGAARVVRFGSVDVGNTDLHTLEPDRVPIHDAIVPAAGEAHGKAGAEAATRIGGVRA